MSENDVKKNTVEELLNDLLADANALDANAFPPNGKVEKGEKVLMTIDNEPIKKLYGLMQMYERDALRLVVDARFEKEDSDTDKEATRARDKALLLRTLFWYSLKEAYPTLWGIATIGIRKDWVIVEVKDEEHPLKGLIDFFQRGGQ